MSQQRVQIADQTVQTLEASQVYFPNQTTDLGGETNITVIFSAESIAGHQALVDPVNYRKKNSRWATKISQK